MLHSQKKAEVVRIKRNNEKWDISHSCGLLVAGLRWLLFVRKNWNSFFSSSFRCNISTANNCVNCASCVLINSVTSPACQVSTKIVLRPWKDFSSLSNKQEQRRGWSTSNHRAEGLRKHFCSYFHLETGCRATPAKRNIKETKKGVELKLCSCWFVEKLQCPGAVCSERQILPCSTNAHPLWSTFHPMLTFSPDTSSFELDVWSIVSVARNWQHRDHQSAGGLYPQP